MVNLIIDRYEIMEELGSGGFGTTFLAKDTRMPSQRIIVLKKLKPISQSDIDYQVIRESFTKEAAVLENLEHQSYNIPKLYDHFEQDGDFYLVQEYIKGDTLAKISPISQEQTFFILTSLLKILVYVHSKKIIHRDIKPENIIIRESDGVPFLIDFGAVKDSMGKTQLNSGTVVSSKVIGTKGYMAPEQSAGCTLFSSDLYSTARTMIYALTRKLPIEFEMNPITGELDWQKYALEVDPKLANILNKANKISPELRYSTAKEMNEDLHYNSQFITQFAIINPQKEFTKETINLDSPSNIQPEVKPHPKDVPTVILPKSNPPSWKPFMIGGVVFCFIGLVIFFFSQSRLSNKVDDIIVDAKDLYIAEKYKDCLDTAKNALNESERLLIFNQNSLQDEANDIQNKCQFKRDEELLTQAQSSTEKQNYLEGIKTAQQMSNYDNNFYEEAQTLINDNVHKMLINAEAKYNKTGDSNASSVEVKPLLNAFEEENKLYQEVNYKIEKWRADEKSNKEKLSKAESELKKGNWDKSYDIANSVTTTYYKGLAKPIKEKAFESKHKSLLASAKKTYQEGNVKNAVSLAKQIDRNASVYAETQELLNQWQLELNNLESNIEEFIKHYFEDINNRDYESAWSRLSNNYHKKQSQDDYIKWWNKKYVSLKNVKIETKSDIFPLNLKVEYDYIEPEEEDKTVNISWCLRKDNSSLGFKFEPQNFCK